MLICIADSEYFNIALKAYINEPNSKPLDIKEILCYPFSGQSEMFYTFFATDAGARLSTILIDYSSVSIEVLQVALSLKSFNPLIRIFILPIRLPVERARTQPRHCARRRVHHQFLPGSALPLPAVRA